MRHHGMVLLGVRELKREGCGLELSKDRYGIDRG